MPSIDQIPVAVASQDEVLTGQAEAVLTEIAAMLKRLLDEGTEDSVDLRSLPLSMADRNWLDSKLGRGEVEILLDAGGRSVLTETAYPGVWKVVHRDDRERVVAELIEVARVPAIVKADGADIKIGYESLLLNLMGEPGGA